jgi:hypothetical protein
MNATLTGRGLFVQKAKKESASGEEELSVVKLK